MDKTWNEDHPITFNYARTVAVDAIEEHIEWLWDHNGAIPEEVYTSGEAKKLTTYLRGIQKQIKGLKKGGKRGTAKTRK